MRRADELSGRGPGWLTYPMRVGLTGGIASGKSTVSAILAELGAVVIDADAIAREVVARGTTGLARVVEAFGPGVLTAAGDLDRPKVAEIVFHDPEKLRRLEAITHPLIGARVAELEKLAGTDALVVHDHPLLVETGLAATMDRVIVVDLPGELQVQRATERGLSPADARARIAHQASREDRLAVATDVIDNSGTPDELRSRVEELYADLTRA